MSKSMRHLLQESFVPVLLFTLGLFLSLIYAEYRTVRDADAVTVIRIDSDARGEAGVKEDIEPAADVPLLAVQENSDPRLLEAARLTASGRWKDADTIYRAMLSEKSDPRVFNDLGVLYLKKGDYRKSIDYFNEALSNATPYPRAYLNRALAHTKLGDVAAAVTDYQSLVKLLPYHFEAHHAMGALFLKLRDHENAAVAFEKARELAGGEKRARANIGLGTAYAELGRKAEARTAFEAAIRLRPDEIAPRLALATLEENTRDGRRRALDRFEEVFKLKPDHPPAYFSLARFHSNNGDFASAEEAYRKAVKFNPEFRNAHYNLGLLLLSQRRHSEARTEFEWIIKRDPEHAESHFNLARAAYGLKDNVLAVAEYGRAIELRGGNYPEAYLNQGLVFAALMRHAEAETAYRKAIKLNERYPEAWYNLGVAQLKQNRWGDANRSFATAIKHEPRYEQAWFNLGVLAGREDKDDAAIDAYRRALAIRPDYPEARLNLAVRYARQKRHDEAIAEYRSLLEQDDTYALAWLNLGYAYQEVKAFAKAEEALRRSLGLEPGNLKAWKALATSLTKQRKYDEAGEAMVQAIALDAADPQLRLKFARVLVSAGKPGEALVELEKARRLDPGDKKIAQEFDSVSKKI